MSLRPHHSRQMTCEICGRQCHAEQKERDICRTCLRKEPSTRCTSCGIMKHLVSVVTGLCPRCTIVRAKIPARCARCSRTCLIHNQEEQLCQACDKKRRANLRNKDKQIKVACSVCGELRYSMRLDRVICPACYKEECNGRSICLSCNKLKVIQAKSRQLCKQCYKDYLAPKALQRYVDDFVAPSSSNTVLFDLLASTIVWESVTEKVYQKFRAFGRFLQMQKLSEPLTWTTIEEALPMLGSANRTQSTLVRACLRELGHLLVARGDLESWQTYLVRRSALQSLKSAPQAMQDCLHRYTTWLWERQTAANNVREHLRVLASFWSWCGERGIAPRRHHAECCVKTVEFP